MQRKNSNISQPIHIVVCVYTLSTIQSADHFMNIQLWLLIRTRYVRTEILQLSTEKTKISRIRYNLVPTTANNHPHHLGTDVTFSLPRPQHLKKTLINKMYPSPLFGLFFCIISCYGWWFFFALGVVADVCCWPFFPFGAVVFFAQTCSLLLGIVFLKVVIYNLDCSS